VTTWRLRCPACGAVTPWEAPDKNPISTVFLPEPHEELDARRILVRCVAPTVPLTRQIRRALARGDDVPICGTTFAVRVA
jgi:hypothetical protein